MACSGHLFCVSCPKRVATSPSPTWHLRASLSYLGSSQAPDVRSSPAWQIPKAGEAIPDCPGQILPRSCLSCATQRRQAAYRALDLREKGATPLSGEQRQGDAGDGPLLQGHRPATPGYRVQSTGAIWEKL